MFRNGKIENSNVWEKEKLRIPMFKKGKIQNSNVWKRKNLEIPMFGKGKSRSRCFLSRVLMSTGARDCIKSAINRPMDHPGEP